MFDVVLVIRGIGPLMDPYNQPPKRQKAEWKLTCIVLHRPMKKERKRHHQNAQVYISVTVPCVQPSSDCHRTPYLSM